MRKKTTTVTTTPNQQNLINNITKLQQQTHLIEKHYTRDNTDLQEAINNLKTELKTLQQQTTKNTIHQHTDHHHRLLALEHNQHAHTQLAHPHLEHQIRKLSHWANCATNTNNQPCDCQTTPGKPTSPITWPLNPHTNPCPQCGENHQNPT